MSAVSVEHVLVVPTELFHRLGHFQGFSADAARYLDELLRDEHTSYRPRPEMEEDPSFKQLIPYVLLEYQSEAGPLLFQYLRGGGQGEKRLHARRSVGVGGHISSEDADHGDPYEIGMQRELDEEVIIETEFTTQCLGLINDDESEVGRVHLGVVHKLTLEAPQVKPREEDLLEAGFVSPADLLAKKDELETWSKLVLEALYG